MRRSILMIVAIMLIGCNEVNGGGTTTPSNITNQVITPRDTEPNNTDGTFEEYKPVELNLDDLTFEEAFRIQHRAKGEDHTFWWRGTRYTTNLWKGSEFVYAQKAPDNVIYDIRAVGYTTWVRNSDDRDDKCYSNIWDACGVCDGPGAVIWYLDRDEDGLGDAHTYTENCNYPSVDEE